MSTYTKITPELSNNIYFLNDKNIVLDVDENISENAVPSQKLFKEKYDELSTYDSNLCTYVSVLNEKTNTLSNNLSGEIDSLSAKLSADLSTEIENRISAVENLSTSLSNTADEKFVLKSGDLMETLSVAGKTELSGDIVVPNHNTKVTIGNAVAPREGMFVWNSTEDPYYGKETDGGEGNTFSINPSHELCGVFVGEKSLCAYITEDVALTATEIRGEISTVSSLLTGNYALSSDVSAVSKLVNDSGYLVSDDFDFKYDSVTKAIWLSAGNKSISIDAIDFIKDGMLSTASIEPIIEKDETNKDIIKSYALVLTFNTYTAGEINVTPISVDLSNFIDIYKAEGPGIQLTGNNTFKLDFDVVAETSMLNKLSGEVKDISANHETRLTAISNDLDEAENEITKLTTHAKSLQDYAKTLSGNGSSTGTIVELSTSIKQTNEKHQQDFEYFNNILQNNATFAGTIQIDIENNVFKQNDKLSALLENQNSNSNRVLKSGDIYQIEFINNDFTNNINDPFRCEKTFYDTSDKPSVRLAHKDYIVIYTPNIGISLTYDNVHKFVKVIPAVRFYELYQLSVTVSSDYFWLSGGNNKTAGHAISGDNYFLGRNDIEDLSVKTLSADWKNVKHSDNGYSLYDLSVALSNKIYIDDRVDKDINGTSDLSIVKISKEDYDNTVALEITPLSANVLYIVDSNYIDAYGQVIRNLTMDEDLTASEATNKHYVDSLCASLSDTVILSVENLQNQIISETARAEGVELGLRTDLDNEINRSTNKDNELDQAIKSETARAEGVETNLITKIETETQARIDANSALDKRINTNAQDITTEIARAKGAEEALKANINTKADNDKLSNYILKSVIIDALKDIEDQSELSDIRQALINLKTVLAN